MAPKESGITVTYSCDVTFMISDEEFIRSISLLVLNDSKMAKLSTTFAGNST